MDTNVEKEIMELLGLKASRIVVRAPSNED